MNSFYGGKEGRTYHIVKAFPTISSMTSAFGQGAGYPEVAYGEYVIINTDNRNDKDNGKIYRRGLNFTNASSGAIYIGQIQGPDGRIPPMTMAKSWEEFLNYGIGSTAGSTFSITGDDVTYKVVDKATTFSPPTTKKAYQIVENTTYQNPIKIGFETYADKDQTTRKGIIGIDIPQPVVEINSTVIPASSNGSLIPVNQTTTSQNLSNQGIQYYAYDINIPVASNFEIKRNQGTGTNFSTYSLQYNTITSANEYGIASSTVDFSLVDGMRYHPNNTDLIQYHISGSNASTLNNGWRDLFNPNGQFHIYAKYDWTKNHTLLNTKWLINEVPSPPDENKNYSINCNINIDNNNIQIYSLNFFKNNNGIFEIFSDDFEDDIYFHRPDGVGWWFSDFDRIIEITGGEDINNIELITWLKNNAELLEGDFSEQLINDKKAVELLKEKFPYGIRTQTDSEIYDITQAGWLISVELEKEEEEGVKKYSALYAYDYLPSEDSENKNYTLSDFTRQVPDTIKPKGWFQVQDFNSSLASDPEEIIIIGTEEAASPSTISLKQNGLWLQGYEKGGKWWLQET